MLSVLLPARDPNAQRLERTLAGLAAQSLDPAEWELIVVDNGSTPPLAPVFSPSLRARVVVEPVAGLTRARLCGINHARGDLIVFVDDDNVLTPNYLASVVDLFARHPRLGAAGGPIKPEFEEAPPDWAREFFGLLALRDLGSTAIVATGGPAAPWPNCAPVGAGLSFRRSAVTPYLEALAADPSRLGLDRAGRSLASGGDNDLVFTILHAGWDVGYFPELSLTHLIPAGRLRADYLARLNEGIMRTWVRVLALHGHCPWSAIPRWSVPLRAARAWLRFGAWRSPAHAIRWRGAVGQFNGQADLSDARHAAF